MAYIESQTPLFPHSHVNMISVKTLWKNKPIYKKKTTLILPMASLICMPQAAIDWPQDFLVTLQQL